MKQSAFFNGLLFALLSFLLMSCARPSASDQQRDAASLPKVFDTLQTLEVEAYRNQDWCKNIAYQRGKFSSNLKATTCNLFDGTPQPMDAQATQNFQAIAHSMATTGVSIHFLSAQYDVSHHLSGAEFHLATLCRCSYVYSPQFNDASSAVRLWYSVRQCGLSPVQQGKGSQDRDRRQTCFMKIVSLHSLNPWTEPKS